MSAPNRNTLWARVLVDELVRGGVSAVCITPGSRSTPLTAAFARRDDVRVFSHLDERASAYFALGRAKRTGEVTPLVCTSGTAAANFHPAVVEAAEGRVPLLLLTADRPPELRDSGANQTIDQEELYGDAVRWDRDLPEPEPEPRKLRSLRTTAGRALAAATGVPAGPVHLNVPFRKPLEPTPVEGDVPADLPAAAERGREGDAPYVRTTAGTPELDDRELRSLAEALSNAERGLVVAGPSDAPGIDPEAVTALLHATGFPLLADPLSGLRFGGHTRVVPVFGGYDAFLAPEVTGAWPDPDVVVRTGASPTSKPLRKYLARTDARQFVIDPAGEWREAEFAATDLVVADPSRLAGRLASQVRRGRNESWHERLRTAEEVHWEIVDDALGGAEFDGDAADEDRAVATDENEAAAGDEDGTAAGDERTNGAAGPLEGRVLADVAAEAPDPSTLVVSNSTPVRDADRFARPSTTNLTVLGNRGASGIDGVTSTALGAGSAATDHLTLVTGDLAYYHDLTGLLAIRHTGVDVTIVLVNNDGGGIFHMLPIEEFDPPFTGQFKTPHGLDFEPTGELFEFDFERVDPEGFREAYADAVAARGTRVVEVPFDAETSHRTREQLRERLIERLT